MKPWIAAATLALALNLIAAQVLACGACVTRPGPPGPANPAYVAQKAERIFFGFDPLTKRSVAWVEIRYTGQPEDFGWVVPMPKKPTIGVGATYLFDRLDQATAPRLTMKVGATRENCRVPQSANSGGGFGCVGTAGSAASARGDFAGQATNADASGGGSKVVVVEQSTIGPYSYAILASTDSADLVKWLNDNNYVTPKEATPTIDAHLKKGDVFVALKLLNNKGIDAIRPVTFTMDDADPCVPLRLTSIAAVEDMEVIVYLAGPGRGMPKNHLHVQVNPYRLAWENGGGNYGQVLATAIDEAAGRAFATEFAGPTKGLAVAAPPSDVAAMSLQFGRPVDAVSAAGKAYQPGEIVPLSRLDSSAIAEVTTTAQLAAALKKSKFLQADEVIATLDRFVLGPAAAKGIDWAEVEATGAFNPADLPNPATKIDGKALAAELALFAGGLKDAMGLIAAQPTLTRLSMRISPKEMTRDPLFAFHPKLPDVHSNWSATLTNVCTNGDNTDNGARLQITGRKESHIIRNGHAGFTTFQTVAATVKTAFEPRFAKMPAAAVVEVLDETLPAASPVGAGQIELVDLAIGLAVPGAPTLPKDFVLKPAEARLVVPAADPNLDTVTAANGAAADPGGCKLGHHGRAVSAFALVALAMLAVVAARRRAS